MNDAEIGAVAEALRAGKVVAIPTDTVYGLAVDPRAAGAVSRLFAAKGRPVEVAVPVLIADPVELADLAVVTPPAARLASRYWPGPLTLVLARRPSVDFDLGGDRSTVGIRCPSSSIAHALLGLTGPLAVTSANRHGQPPLHTADEVREHLGGDLELVLDGGRCDGRPSTVISIVEGDLACLRLGTLDFDHIAATAAGLASAEGA